MFTNLVLKMTTRVLGSITSNLLACDIIAGQNVMSALTGH